MKLRSFVWSGALLVAGALLAACNTGQPAPQKDGAAQPNGAAVAQSEGQPGAAVAPKGDDVMDECPGKESHACGQGAPANGDDNHFGKPFALKDAQALTTAAEGLGAEATTVQVKGTVGKVCKKMGCWMVLRDGDTEARVFTHAGDFYLPTDTAEGRSAVVEGQLKAKTLSKKFAKHLAEDQGEDPEQVEGPRKELVIQATAIALK